MSDTLTRNGESKDQIRKAWEDHQIGRSPTWCDRLTPVIARAAGVFSRGMAPA
jgi:hypothetical protein